MKWLGRLATDHGGAVAPTVALSLVGLIAAGGLAFDYAHLASLDTEMQQAADQAALAAATQLDGASGACARASAAAASLLSNETRFANDKLGRAVSVTAESTCDASGSIRFYQSYDEATDTPGSAATNDGNAKVVIVDVTARRANYALTPIGAMTGGTAGGSAVATLSSSVCKVPPLMICAPSTSFPTTSDIGKGALLEPGGGGGTWVPGNYGYLDFGNGASGVKTNLGANQETASCTTNDTGITTETGNMASVTKALNTRFDLYAASITTCDPTTGNFCPSANAQKDLAFTETVDVQVKQTDPIPANPGCGAAGAKRDNGDNNVDSAGQTMSSWPLGFPRDTCHVDGSCTSKFGDGGWGKAAFVASAHPATTASAIALSIGKTLATLTRWDVYSWELADKAARLAPYGKDLTASPVPFKDQGQNRTYTFTNRCAFPQPVTGTGLNPSASQKDRRLLTVAVVDCTGQTGKFNGKVLRFADMFLVEPSLDRKTADGSPYATGKDQIYAEVVRVAERPNGQSAFQYYLRQRPRLLK